MSSICGTAAGAPHPCVRRVLVVDDEPGLAELAATLLRFHGFEVVVAACARDALRMLANDGSIDAIFSDVTMPGMNGVELADAVAAAYHRIRIVITSGYMAPPLSPASNRRHLFTAKPYLIQTVVDLLRGAPLR